MSKFESSEYRRQAPSASQRTDRSSPIAFSGGDDWFYPAMTHSGSLAASLDLVLETEKAKYFFIEALKQKLCVPAQLGSDAISCLRLNIQRLKRSVDLRAEDLLGLETDRWLKPLTASHDHLISGKILRDPVCLPFEPIKAKALQLEIKTAWLKRADQISFWPIGSRCLWLNLLAFNKSFDDICALDHPFDDLRLDELPEGLPDDIACESLQTFLSRTRGALNAARKDLDRCFETLWKMSEPFFDRTFSQACSSKSHYDAHRADQAKQQQQQYQNHHDSRRGSEHRFDGSRTHNYSFGKNGASGHHISAMSFMGFTELPSHDDLRRRYHALARKFHPDCQNGSDDAFRQLVAHYKQLRELCKA
jgi:hypothetical protein